MMKNLTPVSLFCLSMAPVVHAAPAPYVDVSQLSTSPLVAQAIRHEHGEGVPKNTVRAVELYCAAARMGNIEAAYRLGWMYANGRGLPRNDAHAVALFTRAASQGHADAKRLLALISAKDPQLPPCVAPMASQPVPAQTDTAATSEPPALAQPVLAKTPSTTSSENPPPAASDNQAVATAIAQWAQAWSRKDIEAYFRAYAKSFAVPGGRSLRQWEQERRARIAGKSWITVKIDALNIAVDGNRARATFLQNYHSDQLVDATNKTLELVKIGPLWLIQRERSGE